MKKFKIISTHIALFSFFLLPLVVLNAQGTANPPGGQVPINIGNPFNGGNDFISLLTAILQNIVMPIAAVGVVMYIIYAGFTFVTAQGKPAEIAKAQQRLLWALVGAGILLGAEGISLVVRNTVTQLIK